MDNISSELLNQLKYQMPMLLMSNKNMIYIYVLILSILYLFKLFDGKSFYKKNESVFVCDNKIIVDKISDFLIKYYSNVINKGEMASYYQKSQKIYFENSEYDSYEPSMEINFSGQKDIKIKLSQKNDMFKYKPDHIIFDELFHFKFNVSEKEEHIVTGPTEQVIKKMNKFKNITIKAKNLDYINLLINYMINESNITQTMNDKNNKKILYYNSKKYKNDDYLCDNVYRNCIRHDSTNLKKSFDNIFLSQKNENLFINNVRKFIVNRKKYTELGIPHKLGFLLHGEPGCGKSACILACANELKKKICYVKLNAMSRSSLIECSKLWNDHIVVFEEIDICTFTKSRNDEMRDRLNDGEIAEITSLKCKDKIMNLIKKTDQDDEITLDTILLLLDGYFCLDNSIVFMTTNHKDKLDPALYRKGRIDHEIEFKLCDRYQLENIYKTYYKSELNPSYKFIENKISTSEIINSIFLPNIDSPKSGLDLLSKILDKSS